MTATASYKYFDWTEVKSVQNKPKVDTGIMDAINIILITIGLMIVGGKAASQAHSNAILAAASSSTTEAAEESGLSASLTAASALAAQECATKFRGEIWNCPAVAFQRLTEMADSREAAVVQAMASAAIIHIVARNCSAGQLEGCGCGKNAAAASAAEDWEWGGCSDNLDYGSRVAERHIAVPESLVARHNHATGRVAVRRSQNRVCKCHGVSGSCSLQTCWTKSNDFAEVGRYLHRQYKKAVKVEALPSGLYRADDAEPNRVHSRNLKALVNDRVRKRKLVYTSASPNYCLANPLLAFPGVLGRACTVEATAENPAAEIKTCSDACTACGLTPALVEEEVEVTCKCKFEWCCDVQCQKCKGTRTTVKCVKPQRNLVKTISSNST